MGGKDNQLRILVSAAASAAAVSIIEYLQSQNYWVVGIDANQNAVPLGESVCDEFYLCPMGDDPEFVEFIVWLSPKFDWFLSFVDEELFSIANASLPDEVRKKVIASDDVVLNCCLDKRLFQQTMENYQAAVAATAMQPPAFFKPAFGRGGKGVELVETQAQWYIKQKIAGIFQQAIDGQEYTLDLLFDAHGQFIYGVPRKRLLANGVSTIGEVVCDSVLVAKVVEELSCLKLKYLVNAQCIVDADRQVHIIEVNPRLAGSLIFSLLAGADLLNHCISIAMNKPTSQSLTHQPIKVFRCWQEKIL